MDNRIEIPYKCLERHSLGVKVFLTIQNALPSQFGDDGYGI